MSEDLPSPEDLRRSILVKIGNHAHTLGEHEWTVCGLDPTGAYEAPRGMPTCQRCERSGARVSAEEKLRIKVSDLTRRLRTSNTSGEVLAGRLASIYALERKAAGDLAQLREEFALLKRETAALKAESAALAEAARMWRAIVEGEAVPGDGSDEDYLLARPVPVPRFAK